MFRTKHLIALLRDCLSSQSHESWPELIGRLQPVAASSILRAFRQFAASQMPTTDLVDDLVQQTYTRLCEHNYRVLRNLSTQDEQALLAYVRTVAANLVIDYLRTQRYTFAPVDPEMAESSSAVDRFILLESVDRHLEDCSEADAGRDRRVFWLYYLNGLTSKAIAGISDLGLSQKGVESLILRLSRCVRKAIATDLRKGSISAQGNSLNAAV